MPLLSEESAFSETLCAGCEEEEPGGGLNEVFLSLVPPFRAVVEGTGLAKDAFFGVAFLGAS